MAEDVNESTRVMPVAGGQDRTMVAQPPIGAGATQMGATVACAICNAANPALETYCVECGFLLASAPGIAETPDGAPQEGPELVEAASGRRFSLKQGANIVGREGGDVLLMDSTVSRRHAQIELQDGRISVTDLGSTNGTSVDGRRIDANAPTSIEPGSTLRFGNATLSLVLPGEEPPVASGPVEVTRAIGPDEVESGPELAEATVMSAESQTDAEPRAGQKPLARLKPVQDGGRQISILEGTNTIGRRAGNDVVISGDPYVSGRHAEITCDSTGCYLTDVGSTNGTVVNGARLTPQEKQLLMDGDEVSIGQGAYVFETVLAETAELPGEADASDAVDSSEGSEAPGEELPAAEGGPEQ